MTINPVDHALLMQLIDRWHTRALAYNPPDAEHAHRKGAAEAWTGAAHELSATIQEIIDRDPASTAARS
jgi:hypothetical protein